MPKIEILTYPLVESAPGLISYSLSLGEKTPSKAVEIKTVADCKRELGLYAEEMKATGKAWRLSVYFHKRSGRKPAGFDKACTAGKLVANVNEHLVRR